MALIKKVKKIPALEVGLFDPFLNYEVSFFLLFPFLIILLSPLTVCFWQLKDIWNVINYLFVIPAYFSGALLALVKLQSAITKTSTLFKKNSIEDILKDRRYSGWAGKLARSNLFQFIIFSSSLIFQLIYMINDLGIFSRQPIYTKWTQIYEGADLWMPISVFFCCYIFVQYVLLIFGIYILLALH